MTALPLADYITRSKDGEWGQGEPFEGAIRMRVIRGTDFDAVRLGDWSSVPIRYVAKRHADAKMLHDNDIIIETAGGSKDRPTGRTLLVEREALLKADLPVTCASFARFIRLDARLVEPAYVYWWLQYLYETRQLLAFHTQHTGVARFQWTTCSRSITIPPVDRDTQLKIAVILSAYDDLIEATNRRTKVLEEMAQRIYHEWFVDFRYPGHQLSTSHTSDGEVVPESWAIARLGEHVEFLYGRALRAADRRPGNVTVFGSGGPIGQHDVATDEGPGIIVGRKGNVGSVFWSDGPFFAIDTTYWIRTQLPMTYCYFALQDMEFIDTHAAVPGLSREQAYSLPMVVPAPEVVAAFDAVVRDLFTLKSRLQRSIAALRATRDLLLPRLITGQIDVSDLDIAMPPVAA